MGSKTRGSGNFRLRDFLLIVCCLSGAAYSLYLFRADLLKTINVNNAKPAGIITIKKNVVQRRIEGRVLWDRLFTESPVYAGDLIRVADSSAATLNLDENLIDLNENTLIHIQRLTGGGYGIDLNEGSMGLSAASKMTVTVMGLQLELGPGTTIRASAGTDGVDVHISEGLAIINNEGQNLELSEGAAFSLDPLGVERLGPAAVVTSPRFAARYIKNGPEPLAVNFTWNRINLQPQETLRLEVAEDRDFSRNARSIENLNAAATVPLDAGFWHWRLSREGQVLSSGYISIVDVSGLTLLSPKEDTLFRYRDSPPRLYFQWSETEEASYYLMEAGETPDFAVPRVSRQTAVTSFSEPDLGPGTWYWRVRPIFSSEWEGAAAYSQTGTFRIEQGDEDAVILAASTPREVEPLTLLAPVSGVEIAGLTALRQQTVFRWQSGEETKKSRFVLSKNSDPTRGKPAVEILNPGKTVRLDGLGEGVWYWTVEAETTDGYDISAKAPRRLRVLPIPLLPAPENRRPANGQRFGMEELRKQSSIVFNWSAVQGANAYIVTIFQQTSGGRRQVTRSAPVTQPSWTLSNLSLLDQGTVIWQVEAVSRARNGTIEQRGRIGENSLVIDIPIPGKVQIEDPGVLYGN